MKKELKSVEKSRLLRKTLAQLQQALVVVEGDNDERALRKIGLEPELVIKMRGLNARKTADAVEKQTQGGKKIVLLVDFDEEGRRKERELSRELAERSIAASQALRRNFRQLFRISRVEELPRALERIEQEIGEAE